MTKKMSIGWSILGLVFVFCVGNGYPSGYGYYPKRAVMFGGYYSNPMPAYEYVPQGQMTAMVSGDTVATNSFSGQPWSTPAKPSLHESAGEETVGSQFNRPVEQITEKIPKPSLVDESLNEADVEYEPDEQEGVSSEEPVTETALVVTTKSTKFQPSKKSTPKRKPKKPVKQEEDDDEDEGLSSGWPFGSRRGGVPAYNAFFPIFIGGGSSRSRTRSGDLEEGGYYPGSATAIANSFSTGKGGVATSHATSFGDPYAAAVMRNSGLFNFRTKGKNPQAQLED